MGLAAAIVGAGAISGVAAIGSGVIGASAASSAANTQSQAARYAADLQHQQYEQTRSDLLPYNSAGQQATGQIQAMNPFNFAPTQAQLESTPGYQFNLSQGLLANQNSASARGLGISGAALKGADTFAQGLAGNTYQQQFGNALQTYGTNLGRLQDLATRGENAGAQTGTIGAQLAGNAGQALIGGANASAAGQIGVANAWGGALGRLGNTIGQSFLTSQLFGGGGGGMYGNNPSSGNTGGFGLNDPAIYGSSYNPETFAGMGP